MNEKTLEKYIEGEITPQERAEVVAWLDADEKNVREFIALHKLYDISVMNQTDVEDKTIPVKPAQKKYPLLRRVATEIARIAAIVAIVWSIKLFGLGNDSPMSYQTIYVPVGQRAEVTLPDSTKVWLNSRSSLVYPLAFNKDSRRVTLNGEAYFSVKSNKEKPFIVETKDVNIRVMGTEFNVIAYDSYSTQHISLLEGSVELEGKSLSAKGFRMKPRQSASLSNGKLTISKISDMDYFKWKEGLICFNKELVSDIIKKLELYYDTRIEVNNKHFLKERYSGKFRTKDGIEQVLKILQIEHKFTYTKDNELNLITIK